MQFGKWLSVLSLGALALSINSRAWALDPEDDPDYKGKSAEKSAEKEDDPDKNKDKSGADIKDEDEHKKTLNPDDIERAREAEKANSPEEDPKKTYYFVGLRYRGQVVPQFMIDLFGAGGKTVLANGVGPELTVRKNGFEYVFSAWWTEYGFDWTPFKGKNDPATAWELVKSNIQVLYLTTDFNWTSQVTPVFGLNLGVGAGIGVVWGNLNRVQAYPSDTARAGDPSTYQACTAQGQPSANALGQPVGGFCGADNTHYGNYTEPSWANGGQKPLFFPWIGFGPGIRIKPHRNFMMRVDVGWGLIGPYFGASGNYGI
jgi:hypothetical protein